MKCDVIDVLSRPFLGPWTTFGEGWWGGGVEGWNVFPQLAFIQHGSHNFRYYFTSWKFANK